MRKIILMKNVLLIAFMMVAVTAVSQNIKRESVTFSYTSRPIEPFQKGVENYSVVASQVYRGAQEEAMSAWEAECEAVKLEYEKEMEVYNSKSTGSKVLERALLDEQKPKLILPPQPQRDQKVFDDGVLASKIKLENMSQGTGGVEVMIEMLGYESTPSELSKKEKKGKDGAISYQYSRSLTYRHPVRVTIKEADGSIVIDEVIASTEAWLTHTSKTYNSTSDLARGWKEASVNTRLQQSVVDANLAAVNMMINDKHCFYTKNRTMTIFHAKTTKKADYTALSDAALDMKLAMERYQEKPEETKVEIQKCVTLWEKELEEVDLGDKKARINRKMAGVLYQNIINGYIWLEDYDKAQSLYDELRRLDLKKNAESKAGNLEDFCADQKARKEANE